MTMETIAFADDDERSLERSSATVPDPGPLEVQVEIKAAGICGSDVGAWQRKPAYDFIETPRIPGHEHVGVISELGADIEHFNLGDRVVERPLRSCGVCDACRNGAPHVCESLEITGFHSDGGFAPYSVVPAHSLHQVPDSLTDHQAAVAEPMAVAARATVHRTRITAGDDVLVLGAGPMGAFSALIGDTLAAHITVGGLSRDTPRFAVLEELAIRTVNLETTSASEAANDYADGGFDVVVDATGSTSALSDGMAAARPNGEAVVIGIPSGNLGVQTPDFVRQEQRVSGSYGATAADFERAIEIMQNAPDKLDAMSRSYEPDDIESAFESFANGDVIKPILETPLLGDDSSVCN
jgi:L-iditol 2-dehydrogenase